jgi:hypothetical protein
MQTANQILKKFEDLHEHHFHELDRNWIMEAMEEYSDEKTDTVLEMIMKPEKELKPLEDLWRKENSPDRFVIPDRTEFFKWITDKILNITEKLSEGLSNLNKEQLIERLKIVANLKDKANNQASELESLQFEILKLMP